MKYVGIIILITSTSALVLPKLRCCNSFVMVLIQLTIYINNINSLIIINNDCIFTFCARWVYSAFILSFISVKAITLSILLTDNSL